MSVDVYPPAFATERGRVRSLIPDVEQVDFSGEGVASYLFSDAHIDAFLSLYQGATSSTARIKWAASDALRAIAVSEGLIAKVIQTEDLQTDGAKLASALLRGAADLKAGADADEEKAQDECFGFAIVDFQPYPIDCLGGNWRGFPYCACGSWGSGGGCGCGSYDHGAGFGRWL